MSSATSSRRALAAATAGEIVRSPDASVSPDDFAIRARALASRRAAFWAFASALAVLRSTLRTARTARASAFAAAPASLAALSAASTARATAFASAFAALLMFRAALASALAAFASAFAAFASALAARLAAWASSGCTAASLPPGSPSPRSSESFIERSLPLCFRGRRRRHPCPPSLPQVGRSGVVGSHSACGAPFVDAALTRAECPVDGDGPASGHGSHLAVAFR